MSTCGGGPDGFVSTDRFPRSTLVGIGVGSSMARAVAVGIGLDAGSDWLDEMAAWPHANATNATSDTASP